MLSCETARFAHLIIRTWSAWPTFLPSYTTLFVVAQTKVARGVVEIRSQHDRFLTGEGKGKTANNAAFTLTQACPLTRLAEFRYE